MNGHYKGTALITGASGGIGYELAKIFAQNHYRLVLVARSEEKLLSIAGELSKAFGASVRIIVKDLSKTSAANEVYGEIKRNQMEVDVLVNNAGVGAYGFFADVPLARELEMIQLNVTSLTALTYHCLKEMVERKSGKIMNVASTAAFLPGPLMSVYYATKAYVLSFSEALASEYKGTGVTVTAFCPGATQTGFQKAADLNGMLLTKFRMTDAQRVAGDGYEALMKGKTVAISGVTNQMLVGCIRFLPRSFVTRMLKQLQRKRI